MPTRPKTKRTRKKAGVEKTPAALPAESVVVKVENEPEAPAIPSLYKVDVNLNNFTKTQNVEPVATESDELVGDKKISKNIIILISLVFVLAISLLGYYLLQKNFSNQVINNPKIAKKKIIVEQMYTPSTQSYNMVDAKISSEKGEAVPINPDSSDVEIVVEQAKLTTKQAYQLALPAAQKWSVDAALVFIKSLGTVTSEGKSTQWQIVFFSKEKNKSYEVMVWVDKIAAEKELTAELVGNDLPKNWFDSSDAIISLRSSPQFATGTISSINFSYNEDSGDWVYGLKTSVGGTVMHVQ